MNVAGARVHTCEKRYKVIVSWQNGVMKVAASALVTPPDSNTFSPQMRVVAVEEYLLLAIEIPGYDFRIPAVSERVGAKKYLIGGRLVNLDAATMKEMKLLQEEKLLYWGFSYVIWDDQQYQILGDGDVHIADISQLTGTQTMPDVSSTIIDDI